MTHLPDTQIKLKIWLKISTKQNEKNIINKMCLLKWLALCLFIETTCDRRVLCFCWIWKTDVINLELSAFFFNIFNASPDIHYHLETQRKKARRNTRNVQWISTAFLETHDVTQATKESGSLRDSSTQTAQTTNAFKSLLVKCTCTCIFLTQIQSHDRRESTVESRRDEIVFAVISSYFKIFLHFEGRKASCSSGDVPCIVN